ncbi:uncharacterized protein K02A2.6-like [Macrobrachium nipponense]|uniref:uncharacterized protein K02A2.6-like n=1 Tax=Macrobrachium nipponense TaxID=159736 RepID=UPI0030C876CF
MGFLVLQQHCSCEEDKVPFCCKGGWKLALCGNRHLTLAEVNYAVVEGEVAAVVWCFQKARLFLLGCPNIILVTDHRPLVKVFCDRELKDIANPRLLRLKEKTLQYSFTMKYIPGKKNSAADTLSRYPVIRSPINASDSEMGEEVESSRIAALITSLSDDVITLDWNSVKKAAESDVEYQLLKSMVAAGSWPVSRNLVVSSIKPYFNVRDRLGIVDELVVYSYDEGHVRLVIPVSLRDRVVSNLHSGHQSSDSMIRRARQALYWPGMEGQLKLKRMQCRTCDVIAPSQQKEPLLPTPPPEYPFQQTWGAPEEISLDGGTNLVSIEMASFLQKWGVRMRISSAHYPQSNGRAEAAVRTAKRTIQDNTRSDGSLDTDSFARAILQYRNTPLKDIDKSPAQLAMGRQLRDSVPMIKSYHKITEQWADIMIDREEKMGRHLRNVNFRHDSSAKRLRPLQTGTTVAVQNVVSKAWDRIARVIEMKGDSQYVIKLDVDASEERQNQGRDPLAKTAIRAGPECQSITIKGRRSQTKIRDTLSYLASASLQAISRASKLPKLQQLIGDAEEAGKFTLVPGECDGTSSLGIPPRQGKVGRAQLAGDRSTYESRQETFESQVTREPADNRPRRGSKS